MSQSPSLIVSEAVAKHVHQRLISQCSEVPLALQKLLWQPDNELPCHSHQASITWDGSRSGARQGEGTCWKVEQKSIDLCLHTVRLSTFTQLLKQGLETFSELVPACNCPPALELHLSQSVTGMGQSRKQQHQSQVCFSPGGKLNAGIGEDLQGSGNSSCV